ncbi:MAG: AarF/UbiB family protein, partial [Acidobacteriota bacterium]|nr:AarF/UbiB family protein [Acidobacteriota bacterium]
MELKKLSSIPQIYRNLARWREIIGILSKFGLADLLSRFDSEFAKGLLETPGGEALARFKREQRIRMALIEIGPTGIKLGQILSTRPDLVGIELATELEQLQTEVPASPPDELRATIERELGLAAHDLFAEFDDRPLASASIAQVHAARLGNGDHVVVKVQHPGVREKIRVDLDILAGLAHRAERIEGLRYYRPRQLVAEFQRTILRELNFGSEERNLEEFRSRFEEDSTVKAPAPYPELSTGRVLTMERLDGIKISERRRLVEAGCDLDEIARRGADLYLEMIFHHGFYHADPHPGNIMILPGNVIGLIDFGMVGRIDDRLREEVEDLLLAVAGGDEALLTQVITRVGQVPADLDEPALAADVAEFVSQYGTRRIKDIRLSDALQDMTELVRRYRIVLPPPLSMLIKVLVMLEGT